MDNQREKDFSLDQKDYIRFPNLPKERKREEKKIDTPFKVYIRTKNDT